MLDAILSPDFRDDMEFLFETGCRPCEAQKLTAKDIEFDPEACVARIWSKTSNRTGRYRTISMSAHAAGIVRRLMRLHPTGLLFRNKRGHAWNSDNTNCQIRGIRERAGLLEEAVAYALRHHGITDALEFACPSRPWLSWPVTPALP